MNTQDHAKRQLERELEVFARAYLFQPAEEVASALEAQFYGRKTSVEHFPGGRTVLTVDDATIQVYPVMTEA